MYKDAPKSINHIFLNAKKLLVYDVNLFETEWCI